MPRLALFRFPCLLKLTIPYLVLAASPVIGRHSCVHLMHVLQLAGPVLCSFLLADTPNRSSFFTLENIQLEVISKLMMIIVLNANLLVISLDIMSFISH